MGGRDKLEVDKGSGGVERDRCPLAADYLERDRLCSGSGRGVPKLFQEPEGELEGKKFLLIK